MEQFAGRSPRTIPRDETKNRHHDGAHQEDILEGGVVLQPPILGGRVGGPVGRVRGPMQDAGVVDVADVPVEQGGGVVDVADVPVEYRRRRMLCSCSGCRVVVQPAGAGAAFHFVSHNNM